MIDRSLRMIAIVVCILSVTCFDDVPPEKPPADPKAIQGLWFGSWGGGLVDGVVHQPVVVELFIRADHVELCGFRDVGRLTGNVRLDTLSKRMYITPTAEAGGQPAPEAVVYVYEVKADALTLTSNDKVSINLRRFRVAELPMANAKVEFVAATGINNAGDLLVTEFAELRAGRASTVYFHPADRALKTRHSIVLLAQEAGLKKITVDEARRLIHDPTPVVVTYRHDDEQLPPQLHELWKEIGPPVSESEAVWRTLSRIVRPETLVFILSSRENVPQP